MQQPLDGARAAGLVAVHGTGDDQARTRVQSGKLVDAQMRGQGSISHEIELCL
jgi:hypothetical protein